MRSPFLAAGGGLALFIVCGMTGIALTDVLGVGGEGDEWRTLLQVALYMTYVCGFIFALGGLFLFIRRMFW